MSQKCPCWKYSLALVIFGQMTLQAHGVRPWPYDELAKASDAVLIIEPLKTENNNESLAWGDNTNTFNFFQGVSTTFKVHCCFKGIQPPDEIVVKHFEAKNMEMGSGPTFIQFLPGPLKYERIYLKDGKKVGDSIMDEPHPCWLAFLKKSADGSFVPVAGQIDTGLSFKALHSPSFFIGE
jgi:hypothetical protein